MIWKPGQKSGSGKAGDADLRFTPRRNFIKGAIGHNLQQSKGNGGQKEKGKYFLKNFMLCYCNKNIEGGLLYCVI